MLLISGHSRLAFSKVTINEQTPLKMNKCFQKNKYVSRPSTVDASDEFKFFPGESSRKNQLDSRNNGSGCSYGCGCSYGSGSSYASDPREQQKREERIAFEKALEASWAREQAQRETKEKKQ